MLCGGAKSASSAPVIGVAPASPVHVSVVVPGDEAVSVGILGLVLVLVLRGGALVLAHPLVLAARGLPPTDEMGATRCYGGCSRHYQLC